MLKLGMGTVQCPFQKNFFGRCAQKLRNFVLFLNFPKIFRTGYLQKKNFCSQIVAVFWKLQYVDIFHNLKLFLKPVQQIQTSRFAKSFQVYQFCVSTITNCPTSSKTTQDLVSQKISKCQKNVRTPLISLPEMIFFALALNYYAKADIKVFYSCQALLDLLIF